MIKGKVKQFKILRRKWKDSVVSSCFLITVGERCGIRLILVFFFTLVNWLHSPAI